MLQYVSLAHKTLEGFALQIFASIIKVLTVNFLSELLEARRLNKVLLELTDITQTEDISSH